MYQPGIIADSYPSATFLVIRVAAAHSPASSGSLSTIRKSLHTIREAVRSFPTMVEELNSHRIKANMYGIISFGPTLWGRLGYNMPSGFRAMDSIGSQLVAPATGGDIFIHLRSNEAGANFAVARDFVNRLGEGIEIMDEVQGFRYLDSRDLTGFVDGTENPKGENRQRAVILSDGEFAGGSFVVMQRYVHDLKKWNAVPVENQEQIVGRTKEDDVEKDGDELAPTAHIARAKVKRDGKTVDILRHSMPYGTVTGDEGLFFVAYARDLDVIDEMLKRMFGASGDQVSDKLLNYTSAFSGGYFFAPPLAIVKNL